MNLDQARPLDTVLTPPQRNRLRQLLGRVGSASADRLGVDIDGHGLEGIELTGEGWHRYAVLAPDRVILLPRDYRWVPGLEREAIALQQLADHDVAAPRLLDRVEDSRLWPHPVLLISRCHAPAWSSRGRRATGRRWSRCCVPWRT